MLGCYPPDMNTTLKACLALLLLPLTGLAEGLPPSVVWGGEGIIEVRENGRHLGVAKMEKGAVTQPLHIKNISNETIKLSAGFS